MSDGTKQKHVNDIHVVNISVFSMDCVLRAVFAGSSPTYPTLHKANCLIYDTVIHTMNH